MSFDRTTLSSLFRADIERVTTNERARELGLCCLTDFPLRDGGMLIAHDEETGETWMIDGQGVEAWVPGYLAPGRNDPSERGIWMAPLPVAYPESNARSILGAMILLRNEGLNPGLALAGSC